MEVDLEEMEILTTEFVMAVPEELKVLVELQALKLAHLFT